MSLEEITNNKGFHCAHLNSRSLLNKFEIIEQLVYECKSNLHVLGISETWLTDCIPDNFVAIQGYESTRLDTAWSAHDGNGLPKKGGGVCLFINENLNWTNATCKHLNVSSNDVEIQWIEIINEKCKIFYIANVYRPPDSNVEDFIIYLENSLSYIDNNRHDIFIMGDFNIDYLDSKADKY